MQYENSSITPNVTIVIPYYKRLTTINQTLSSLTLVDYDLSKLEIVIVDDGSPLEHRPNVDQYKKHFSIQYIWQEDRGYRLSAARNLGISKAQYNTIILLDCDLAVMSSFVKDHVEALSKFKHGISIGFRDSHTSPPPSEQCDFKTKCPSLIATKISEDWRLDRLKSTPGYLESRNCWRLCSGGNIGFSKETFKIIGNFDERFNFWGGEDTEWAYRAYKLGVHFVACQSVNSIHFESQPNEYQVNRTYLETEKVNLLRSLVPPFQDSECIQDYEVPYVSLFVTHFNKLPYLKEALESIELATKYRYEIVLIDDFSNCSKEDILGSVPRDISHKVRYIQNEQHLGIEHTFKRAIELCKGEFIVQLDADDYLLPNSIDNLIRTMNKGNYDLAYSKHKVLKDGELSEGWVCKTATRKMRILSGMYYHPLRVFRSRAIYRVGGMRILGLKGAIDFSLYSQIELACKAVFCDIFTYVYRYVEDSITNKSSRFQIEGVSRVVEDNANLLSATKDYKITQLKERLYNVEFSEQDTVGYTKHLGLTKK